jgi:nucleotidyltransferase/DNA polymerase involved in DNA repair
MKAQRLVYRTGGIKIRFQGFETHTREKSLVSRTDSEEALRTIVESLLVEFEDEGRPVRLVGVRVADLRRTNSESARLDDWAEP